MSAPDPPPPRRTYPLSTLLSLRPSHPTPAPPSLTRPLLDPSAASRWSPCISPSTNLRTLSQTQPAKSSPPPRAASPPRLVPVADTWLRSHPLLTPAESAAALDGALEPPRRAPRRSPNLVPAPAPHAAVPALAPSSLSSRAPPGFGGPPGFSAPRAPAPADGAHGAEQAAGSGSAERPPAEAPAAAAIAGMSGMQIQSLAKRRVAKGPGHRPAFEGRMEYAEKVRGKGVPVPGVEDSAAAVVGVAGVALGKGGVGGTSEIDRLFASATGAAPAPGVVGGGDGGGVEGGGAIEAGALGSKLEVADREVGAVEAPASPASPVVGGDGGGGGLAQWFAALGREESAREISPTVRSPVVAAAMGRAVEEGEGEVMESALGGVMCGGGTGSAGGEAGAMQHDTPELAPDVLSFFNRVQNGCLTDPPAWATTPENKVIEVHNPQPAPLLPQSAMGISQQHQQPAATEAPQHPQIAHPSAPPPGFPAKSAFPDPPHAPPSEQPGAVSDAPSDSVAQFFSMFKQNEMNRQAAPSMPPHAQAPPVRVDTMGAKTPAPQWPAPPPGYPPSAAAGFPYVYGFQPGYGAGAADPRVVNQGPAAALPAALGRPPPPGLMPLPQQLVVQGQNATASGTMPVSRTH